MNCKKILAAPLACGVALSALAFAPVAQAQDTMTSSTTTTTTTTTTSAAPVQVTGTVLRYYVDRSGYVTAADIQTANGIEFVRFAPGMGQRLYTTAPVGGTATVYVTGTPYMGATRWDVVSVGSTMPSPNMVMMPAPSDIDLLQGQAQIMNGAKQVEISGTLRDTITDERGEVLGLILEDTEVSANDRRMMMTSMGINPDATMMTTSIGMPANGLTLVRVPREVRNVAPGYAGTERVTPLFRGSDVTVVGYPEAPRYGVLSAYENRIAASALVVNSRQVGAIGIQRMAPSKRTLLSRVNIGGGTATAEEIRANQQGYTVYSQTTTPVMVAPDNSIR